MSWGRRSWQGVAKVRLLWLGRQIHASVREATANVRQTTANVRAARANVGGALVSTSAGALLLSERLLVE